MTSGPFSFRKKRTALIDADMVSYRVAAMVEKDGGDETDCAEMTPAVISAWAREASCSEIIICKGTKSFRHDVYPEYKANRKDKPKPVFLQTVRDIINDLAWPSKQVDKLEADDVQGILATSKPSEYIIVNNDKDMLTLGGVMVYNPDKMDFPEYTPVDVAEYNLWMQILTGDSTDNYKGVPGCGPVKAKKILDQKEYIYEEDEEPYGVLPAIVLAAYHEVGLSREYLIQMCQCAKILTVNEWDSVNKTFKLWNPYEAL